MQEVGPSYRFYDIYVWLREKILFLALPDLEPVVGLTVNYGRPDFRLQWHGIRIIGLIPFPKGVSLLLEFSKFLEHEDAHPREDIDRFEDACGALPLHKNRLLVLRSLDDIDEDYLDTYLSLGMRLLLAEIQRRHPKLTNG
ncbi:MAG: hypothetical protein R2873_28000 [Caldilineaceae bacterium]